MLGFVFAQSPRQVTLEKAHEIIQGLPPSVQTVGVFVNEDVDSVKRIRDFCGLDYVQLHGDETEQDVADLGTNVIKGLRVGSGRGIELQTYQGATLLLDTYSPDLAGGTGEPFDWRLAVEPARMRPVILAGGLTPENVAEAVELVRPLAVDVSSGVEREPGRKDREKIERFIRRAKAVE